MTVLLEVDGNVECRLKLTLEALRELPETDQIADVSKLESHRAGRAVKLSGVLQLAKIHDDAQWLTLHASSDHFSASIPLTEAVLQTGILIYEINGEPLTNKQGGPIRFLIPGAAVCHTEIVDTCANVKFLDRLELCTEQGRDTRLPEAN